MLESELTYGSENPSLDVVVPLYNETENLEQLNSRLTESLSSIFCDYQIIYVDDGSSDGTVAFVQQLAAFDPQITLLQLSRNFGQPAAIEAGLSQSGADCVVLMDGDLQDPPELIPELYAHWEKGEQVVIAQRKTRQERGLRGLGFRVFHFLFRYLADVKIPPNTGTFCLLDRKAVDSINRMPELHRFFPGLRAAAGFRQKLVNYDRPERESGDPKQSFRRLVKYAADAVFSFSFKPLRLVTFCGLTICVLSFVLAAWFVSKRLLGWEDASIGFTTLTCGVLGLGGFQLVAIGILGEYVGRIYEEVKRRPAFIVAEDSRQQVPEPSTLKIKRNAG